MDIKNLKKVTIYDPKKEIYSFNVSKEMSKEFIEAVIVMATLRDIEGNEPTSIDPLNFDKLKEIIELADIERYVSLIQTVYDNLQEEDIIDEYHQYYYYNISDTFYEVFLDRYKIKVTQVFHDDNCRVHFYNYEYLIKYVVDDMKKESNTKEKPELIADTTNGFRVVSVTDTAIEKWQIANNKSREKDKNGYDKKQLEVISNIRKSGVLEEIIKELSPEINPTNYEMTVRLIKSKITPKIDPIAWEQLKYNEYKYPNVPKVRKRMDYYRYYINSPFRRKMLMNAFKSINHFPPEEVFDTLAIDVCPTFEDEQKRIINSINVSVEVCGFADKVDEGKKFLVENHQEVYYSVYGTLLANPQYRKILRNFKLSSFRYFTSKPDSIYATKLNNSLGSVFAQLTFVPKEEKCA